MSDKVVGVVSLSGAVDWHVKGCSGSDYATLCLIDPGDVGKRHLGLVGTSMTQRVNCRLCWQMFSNLRALHLQDSDFLVKTRKGK